MSNLKSHRYNPSTYETAKQICRANNVTLSKVLNTMLLLFCHDIALQERVLKEAQR